LINYLAVAHGGELAAREEAGAVRHFGRMRILALLLAGVALVAPGCKSKRSTKPKDTATASASTPNGIPLIGTRLEMRDPATASQLLKGFYKVEENWRWTAGQFSVLLGVPRGAGVHGATLTLRFSIPSVVFEKVHDQTMSASISGKQLPPETYHGSGIQTYTRPVPSDLLPGQAVQVDFLVNPVFPPGSADKRELGVIASSITLESK
jgi:hypothetical protein